MREIKFRVYDLVNKRYIKDLTNFWVSPVNFGVFMEWRPELDGETVFETTGLLYEQYTGLKNHEGKEIYEGDLLLLEESWSDFVDAVVWHEDMWMVHDGRLSEFLYCKIVGNIHESK